MNDEKKLTLNNIIKNSKPLELLIGILLYALGAGIIVKSGKPPVWESYLFGQLYTTMFQLTAYYLSAYFGLLLPRPPQNSSSLQKQANQRTALGYVRFYYFFAALCALTAGTFSTIFLYSKGYLEPVTIFILIFMTLLAFFYAMPPLRLKHSGYGEFISAVYLIILTPALACVIQGGEIFRQLGILSFPLVLLYLSMHLATSLETYYQDINNGQQTMMIRMGWQRGMFFHNIFILSAYLLIALSSILGLAWSLTWPRLLTLPLGMFQIFLMWEIYNGAKPRWRLLRLTAYATFGITAYLQVFSLWIG